MLLVGVSIAYFATDIFKGNKELFFKYISQIVDEKEGFLEGTLSSYFEKQKTTPYSDDGTISVNVTNSNNQNMFKNINNMDLTFSGQVNELNNQSEQNISLNYSDNVTFPLIYRKEQDTIRNSNRLYRKKVYNNQTRNTR